MLQTQLCDTDWYGTSMTVQWHTVYVAHPVKALVPDARMYTKSCIDPLSLSLAKGHIDQRLQEEAERLARGEEVEGRYLTYFLSQQGLPLKTVYSNVTELLLAGVDTVRVLSLLHLICAYMPSVTVGLMIPGISFWNLMLLINLKMVNTQYPVVLNKGK